MAETEEVGLAESPPTREIDQSAAIIGDCDNPTDQSKSVLTRQREQTTTTGRNGKLNAYLNLNVECSPLTHSYRAKKS